MSALSKYKTYPEYKDSGIEWLGEIPNTWNLERFKWILQEKLKTSNSNLPAGSISFGKVIYKNEDNLSKDTKASYQEVLIGEFLVNPLNLNFDLKSLRTALATINVVVSTGYIVANASPSLNQQYVKWLLHEFDVAHMKTLGAGVRQTVNFTDISNCYFYLPDNLEQTKIAQFLDHETAKIDQLIEKQQTLIELLKEKRQAVISHAVTKGLDPHVKMKDSGVEWLGEVPKHWEVKSYRYASLIYRGKFGHRPRNDPNFYDGKYPFIQTGDIARADKYINDYSQTLNEKGKEVSQLFPKGSLVMAIAANIGNTAILNFEAYAPDSIVGFKPKNDLNLEFLKYSLMAALPALEQTSTQSTQANLNIDRISAIKASFPPLQEQIKITQYLDSLIEKYQCIHITAEQQIELMKERRTALISAAVTGKIDVRDWQPEQ